MRKLRKLARLAPWAALAWFWLEQADHNRRVEEWTGEVAEWLEKHEADVTFAFTRMGESQEAWAEELVKRLKAALEGAYSGRVR